MSPDDLERCAAALRELAANPAAFLDKRSPRHAALADVRREANRLVEALKGAVRTKRGQPADGRKEPRPNEPSPAVPQTLTVPPLDCYACENLIHLRHAHYRWMCQACGEWNWQKRTQSADLTGRVALVTGGRVRIGFQACLKLLRAGATVHGITRFPQDAVDRYAREPDFASWRERLTLHRLDLCNLPAVEQFAARFAGSPVDILINNAAQTIRPTREFFEHMLRREDVLSRELSSKGWTSIIAHECSEDLASTSPSPTLIGSDSPAPDRRAGQVEHITGSFVDLRTTNSWMARIDQISPVEALEAHFINVFAPFLLIQGLLPAMRMSPWPRRFIVNVAAREGQFAGKASGRHPHTNMAKAALNMLTRSLAGELLGQGISINSVDPGWVSDQRPYPTAERSREEAGHWLPLDDIDAAARLLDLIFLGVANTESPPSGKLWRNYRACAW